MSAVLICLSSDEDDDRPTNKRMKLDVNTQSSTKENLNESIICLDSDEENEDVVLLSKGTLITDNVSNNNSEDVIIVTKDNTNTDNSNEVNKEDSINCEIANSNSVSINKTGGVGDVCTKELCILSMINKENLPNNCISQLSVETANENLDSNQAENSKSVCISSSDDSSDEDDKKSENESELNNSDTSELDLESQESQNPEKQVDLDTVESDLMAKTEDLPTEAKLYLSTCLKTLRKTAAGPIYRKYPAIIKMFKLLSEEFAKSQYLSNYLRQKTKQAEETVSGCMVSFTEVYLYLKDLINSQSIDLDEKHWKFVRKLEKTMKLLMKKLQELEEDEVDFDNEEDSPYIKHDKYSKRLNKIYKKYCEILRKNPYAGRLTYERLDFVSSRFNEINLAISRKYKNNEKFPSYDELAELIGKVVAENNIPLSETGLRLECEKCFKSLGDLLQTRRKKELYEVHQKYLIDEDPAKADKDLDKRLRASAIEGKEKIGQICEEFVRKQELGLEDEEVDLSESESKADEDSEGEENEE